MTREGVELGAAYWQQELEKSGGKLLVQVLNSILEGQNEMRDEIREIRDSAQIVASNVAAISKGFPANDPEGHRQAHELMMQEARDRRDLIRAIRDKTIPALVWAGLIFIGLAMLDYVRVLVAKIIGGGH